MEIHTVVQPLLVEEINERVSRSNHWHFSTYCKYVDFILIPIVEESYTHMYMCVCVCMLCISIEMHSTTSKRVVKRGSKRRRAWSRSTMIGERKKE